MCSHDEGRKAILLLRTRQWRVVPQNPPTGCTVAVCVCLSIIATVHCLTECSEHRSPRCADVTPSDERVAALRLGAAGLRRRLRA